MHTIRYVHCTALAVTPRPPTANSSPKKELRTHARRFLVRHKSHLLPLCCAFYTLLVAPQNQRNFEPFMCSKVRSPCVLLYPPNWLFNLSPSGR
jgi:hypothetical protein